MLAYPAHFLLQSNRMVILTVPDVPEVVVVGYSEDDALRRAPAILDAVLQGYVMEGRSLPHPSHRRGTTRVPVLRRSFADA